MFYVGIEWISQPQKSYELLNNIGRVHRLVGRSNYRINDNDLQGNSLIDELMMIRVLWDSQAFPIRRNG